MKIYLILFAALITISAGCKKNNDKRPMCRINKLIDRFGKEIKVTYNADGKIARIDNVFFDEIVVSTYNENSIVILKSNGTTGTRESKSTLLLNSSGMIDTKRDEYYNLTGTVIRGLVKQEFEYNGLQLMKSTTIDSFYSQESVVFSTKNYTWNDGNLISSVSGTSVVNYVYYTDQPFQQADIESVKRLLLGYDINLYIKNKNLTKSVSWPFSYEFDAGGQIKTTLYEGDVEYEVEYECF